MLVEAEFLRQLLYWIPLNCTSVPYKVTSSCNACVHLLSIHPYLYLICLIGTLRRKGKTMEKQYYAEELLFQQSQNGENPHYFTISLSKYCTIRKNNTEKVQSVTFSCAAFYHIDSYSARIKQAVQTPYDKCNNYLKKQ